LFLICLTLVAGAGCESFRWGEYSYQDLVQRQREQREDSALIIKPGNMNYSWSK
jgi:hypothetical protein